MTETLLRLRADAYYVPVPDGVWIRTTDGSFTLRGSAVARWVERIAPLLDRGISDKRLLAALRPEQAKYVRGLIGILEQRQVVRRHRVDELTEDSPVTRAFGQQIEYLRHFAADPAAALARVRTCPVSVVGPSERASLIAATLVETGFGDVVLRDAEPTEELRELVDDHRGAGLSVRLRGPADPPVDGARLVGLFAASELDDAWRLLDRAGTPVWAGVVRGQAMLLKGQVPGAGVACVRCAWRRLVHPAVGLPEDASLGHVPTAVGAAVLAQELFQHVGADHPARLTEGVVVDLTRLSIWRTAVDPDPSCPGGSHATDPVTPVTSARRGRFPAVVSAARCFGPLVSSSPRGLEQGPLVALRLRVNPPGRPAPAAVGEERGVVVASTGQSAREEAALLAVETTVPVPARAVLGVGPTAMVALGRALCRWAADRLPDGWSSAAPGVGADGPASDDDPLGGVRCQRHPSGLWRALVDDDGRWVVGTDRDDVVERARLAARARRQLPSVDPDAIVPAAGDRFVEDRSVRDRAERLGLCWQEVTLPPLAAPHLVGVTVTPDPPAET
ncbi:hypothetical protein O7606_13445 [Micromonospora sp. WMMD882]|uniref:hypothetical protein n=1 Tax=Micromonospora sp. WMMD882 TaxID=3015151 RepID=UPI00248B6366|nr:hypothetical protein [Micromonospora sp. WMMD882]WBB77305.1 hypothetical protein O7606_13445 [Micromonospora sp. WMMD882]